MKKLTIALILLLFVCSFLAAESIKVSAFTFDRNDRASKYVVKKLDKDFGKIIDNINNFEYIKMKKSDKALKKMGSSNAMEAGKDLLQKVGTELSADLVIWGSVSSVTKTEFDITANILTVKTGTVNSESFKIEKKTDDRRQALKTNIFDKLNSFLKGDIEQDLKIAKQHYNTKNWQDAKDVFERLLKKDDSIEDIYIYLPYIYLQLADYNKCIEFSQKAINKLKTDTSVYHIYIASSYKNLENYEQAITSFKKVAELKKDDIESSERILLNIAKIYSEDIEDEDETINAYKNIIAINPNSKIANKELSDILFDAEEYEEAIPYLQKTVENLPGVAIYEKKLGVAYKRTGKTDAAIDNYKKQIADNPKNVKAYLNLANLYNNNKQPKEVINILLKLKKVEPNNIKMNLLLADAYVAVKDFVNGKKYANSVIKINNTLPEPYFLLAQIDFNQGYKLYAKYNELDNKSKTDKTIVGKDADKLLAKRDNFKAKANKSFTISLSHAKKAKARSKNSKNLSKRASNLIKQLNQLIKTTEKSFFD